MADDTSGKPVIDVRGSFRPQLKEEPEPEARISVAETGALVPAVELESARYKKVIDLVVIQDVHKDQAKQVATAFNFKDTNAVITFAVDPQSRYLKTLKSLLGDARVKDLQLAGEITARILNGIELVGLDQMKKELTEGSFARWAAGLPVIGKYVSAIQLFAARQQELYDLVEEIEKDVQKQMKSIVEDNARLDVMYEDVYINFYELAVYIYAGELALERGKTEFEELRQKAIDTGDSVLISRANMFREQLIAFDSRLLRMKTAYGKAPITMQKILTTQQAGRIELQNLIESLLFDLPAFVETVVMLLALFNLEKAQASRRDRENLRERLEQLEGETLDKVAVAAKEDQARGVREVQLLEAASKKIISTVNKLKEIDQKNTEARRQAETLLVEVITGFRDTMVEASRPDEL